MMPFPCTTLDQTFDSEMILLLSVVVPRVLQLQSVVKYSNTDLDVINIFLNIKIQNSFLLSLSHNLNNCSTENASRKETQNYMIHNYSSILFFK